MIRPRRSILLTLKRRDGEVVSRRPCDNVELTELKRIGVRHEDRLFFYASFAEDEAVFVEDGP